MGEVYLAEDTKLGRTAAIKMIRPEAANDETRKRLLREARAAAMLSHPGIATIYEIDEEEGKDFIAMEHVEGQSLGKIIDSRPMELDRFLGIAIQIADGLATAHEHGVLHRDLKPDNILVTQKDQVKILDFGLAKLLPAMHKDEALTADERLLGTIPYMSPEQVNAEPLDVRSDLFSFGSLLYEMASGKPPFSGETLVITLTNIVSNDPPLLSEVQPAVPPELQTIIYKCLEKNPERRYSSAEEILSDLKSILRIRALQSLPSLSVPRIATPSGISIAVLYFENLSQETESDYFRAGMTEDVITELSKIKVWDVRPRTQVVKFKDQSLDLRAVGRELHVTHILQGSIRKVGSRLRISAQLVESQSANSVWAERYDRDLEDVFEIQSEIAQKIAAALQIHLTTAEKKAMEKRPTRNIEAYDDYLRGREMIFRLNKEGVDSAIEHFEHAIGIDSEYALAYAGLAQARAVKLSFYGGPDSLADDAIENATRALELDGSLAQAFAALGLAYLLKGMSNEALASCQQAMQLNPYDAFAAWILGRLYYRLGRYEDAAKQFKNTIKLLPSFYTAYSDLGQTLQNVGLKDQAVEMYKETIEACSRYLESFPDEARARILMATSCAKLGDKTRAIREGLLAVGLSPDDPVMMYNMACLYSLLNEPEAGIQWLRKSIQHGRRDFEWMQRDPTLENVRNHPSYQALLHSDLEGKPDSE